MHQLVFLEKVYVEAYEAQEGPPPHPQRYLLQTWFCNKNI
jgi:hypothetical protein